MPGGAAPVHQAYVVADRRRGDEPPWLVFGGDSLLIGQWAGPICTLRAVAGQARRLHASGCPIPRRRRTAFATGALAASCGRIVAGVANP